mmetsp:Transcript_9200/g.18819  ORF Transcript_9200/g.18819 Transcript_9200/m.18819 type:complete len:100 (+) Transcript_9200:166-465(+)
MLTQHVAPTGPPCQKFTPKLIKFYNNRKANHKKGSASFELVFVSLGRSEAEYKEYTADMPWRCTPCGLPPELEQQVAVTVGRPRPTAPGGSDGNGGPMK